MFYVLIWSWFDKCVQFVNNYHVIHLGFAHLSKMYVILVNKVYWETKGYTYAPRRHVIIYMLMRDMTLSNTHFIDQMASKRPNMEPGSGNKLEEINPQSAGMKISNLYNSFWWAASVAPPFHFSLFPSLVLLHGYRVGQRQRIIDSLHPELSFLTTSPSQMPNLTRSFLGKQCQEDHL